MTEIKLKTSGASLTAEATGKITSGSIGMPVFIDYDESWNGLSKTVMFRVGNFSRKRENVGTYTTVPWEILTAHGGILKIGIEGKSESGDIVVPTVWANVGQVLQGAQSDIPAAPNPDNQDSPSTGGAIIDDSETSLSKTWSSKKISDVVASTPVGGGSVKSVNGNLPDENGNVNVTSTCELMQPKWGKGELEQLAKIQHDGIYGFSRPMSKERFDKLIAQCEKAVFVQRMGGTEIEVDIGKAEYTDLIIGDSSEPEFSFILWDDNAEYAGYDLVLMGAEITPIPKEYIEPHVKSVNGNYPDENGKVELKNALIVNINLDDKTSDSGPSEFLWHVLNEGGTVFARLYYDGDAVGQYIPLSWTNGETAFFLRVSDDNVHELFIVDENYEVQRLDLDYASFVSNVDFDKTVGDISTALDHIIALQDSLIGGDGA